MNMEDAFIQIFMRKGNIVDQIRRQVHSNAESLSVNFAAAGGGDPPEFLWNNGTGAASDFPLPAGAAFQYGFSGIPYSVGRNYGLQTTLAGRDKGSMNFFGADDFRRFSLGRDLGLQATFMRAQSSMNFFSVDDFRRFSVDSDFVHRQPSSSFMIERNSMNLFCADDERQGFPMDRVPEDVGMDQNLGSDLQKSGSDMRNSEKFVGEKEVEGHCPGKDGKSISNIDQVVRSRVSTEKVIQESGLEKGIQECFVGVKDFENSYPSKDGKEFVSGGEVESLKDCSFEKRSRDSSMEIGCQKRPLKSVCIGDFTGRVTWSKAAKLDLEKKSSKAKKNKDGSTCNGLNAARSRASSMKLRCGKRLLNDGHQSIKNGWVTRSKGLSGKLDLEESSKEKNVDVFNVDRLRSVENLFTEKGINRDQNAEKPDCEKESLKDTDYIGWVTRSKTSSAKLDQEMESTKEMNVDVVPVGYENLQIEEDINRVKEAENAFDKDIEDGCHDGFFQDVSRKLSHEFEHVFNKTLIQGSNETIVQTGSNGLGHVTGSDSPSVDIHEKHTAVGIENNNLLETNNRKRNRSTSAQHSESKKKHFRNPNVHGTTPSSEYLEIIPSEKDGMPLDDNELRTSSGPEYEGVDGFVEQMTVHGDLCNPSEQAQNRTRISTCNVNSTSDIFPERQEAMVFNSSGGSPLKHALCLRKTIATDDNHDTTEDHTLASECRIFLRSSTSNDRKVVSAESNRTSKPSKAVPCACDHDITWPERNKREPLDNIYGTFQRPRLKFFRSSNQCELKRSSVDTSEPIIEFHNSMLSNDANHDTSDTSPMKHSGDIQQMKLQVSEVVPETDDKKQERLTGVPNAVPEPGNLHTSNDGAHLLFCRPPSELEYSSSSGHGEAIENRMSCGAVFTLQDEHASITTQIAHDMNGREDEGATGITDGVYDLKDHHNSVDSVDLLCGITSELEYSSSSGHGEAIENRMSCGAVFTLQDEHTSITTQIVHDMNGREDEGATGITDGVYDLKDHHDSVDGVDLLCGHISKRKSSVLSAHLCAEQSRLSLKENNFSPCIGDAPTIMQTVVSPMEMEEVEETIAGNNNVVIKIKNNHVPEYSELEHKSSYGEANFSSHDLDKSTLTHTVDRCISVKMSPDFECFSFGNSDQGSYDIAKNSCYTEPSPLPNMSDVSHSIPVDLLEHMLFPGSLNFNKDERNQHSCIYESNISNVSLLGKSNSEETSFKRFLFDYDIKSPFTFQADSNSSSRRCSTSGKSVNPGHICFPIDENACTIGEEVVLVEPEKNAKEGELEKTSKEEDIIFNKLGNPLEEEEILNKPEKIAQGVLTSENVISDNEKNLGKEASYVITSKRASTSQKSLDRGSLDSVTTEVYIGMQVNEKKSMGDGCGSSLRYKSMSKKRLVPSSIMKNASRLRSGKSKLSIKSRDENKSIATTMKGFKPTNILSNISSLIPLVQQKKQADAIQTGKREIKVKSLEAAEAVRRNEEIKEKERKMKKEASKLEKIRLDQEKVKQREIDQRKKEEERKKKEEELKARKRQREEDQKNEKKRKVRCLEEKFRQHRQQDKIHAEDKVLQHNAAEQHKKQSAQDVPTSTNVLESLGTNKVIEADPRGKEKHTQEEVNSKLVAKKIQESLPYEMSPFHDSDLEDDNNHKQRVKAIPLWARKESLNTILLSQRHMDPADIFCRKRPFDMNKVLLPPIRPRQFPPL